MADVFKTIKKTWLKGMEAVGNAASSIATNTKQRVNELNLENRRREILSDFGLVAYEMWQKGERFPEALEAQLEELSKLDEELATLKAQRYTNVNEEPGDQSQEEDGADTPSTQEEAPFSQDQPEAAPEELEPANDEAAPSPEEAANEAEGGENQPPLN